MPERCICGRVSPCRLCLPLDPTGEKSGHQQPTPMEKPMPEPNEAFKYNRPDEIAECWDGVISNGDWSLYEALWNAMADMKPLRELIDIEDSSPYDAIGLNTVAGVWDRFTPEQQAKLNELAEARDREWEAL